MKTAAELIAFERRIADLWEAGELPFLIHLDGGCEEMLIDLWQSDDGPKPGDWIFSTHRNHQHALMAGVSEEKVEALIRSGSSMFVFDREKNFVTSAILAGTCCIAAGVAWQLKHEGSTARVFCFLGDGAEEQGHFYEAVLFVDANKLPFRFIVLDNGRQVDTDLKTRRGPILTSDATAHTYHPLQMFNCVERWCFTSMWPHAGSGCKTQIKFNPSIKPL